MTQNLHAPSPSGDDIDDLTQRVLGGLAAARPAPDFEGRLLHSLAAHQTPRRTPSHVALPLRWLVAAAALVLVTLTLVVANHSNRASHSLAGQQGSRPLPVSHPAPNHAVSSITAKRSGRTPPRRTSPIPAPVPDPEATLALAEATAPSQPPPPLPITAEERLIQRFTSRHTAFDLAALAPAAEAAQEAADRRAFHDFFYPPVPAPPSTQAGAVSP